jgi:predicted amidohydrolase YtcJ
MEGHRQKRDGIRGVTDLLLTSVRLGPAAAPVDLLVRDRVIAALGAGVRWPAVETVDAEGRFAVPGLWDHHVHFEQWTLTSRRLNLAGTDSAAAVVALVAAQPVSEQLLVGYGFRDALWPDAPDRDALDDAAGDRAVVLMSGDLHSAWLNSAALRRAGLAEHPTGLIGEAQAMAVFTLLSDVSTETMDGWVAETAAAAAARGVVGIVDLEMPWSLDTWLRRAGDGFRTLRVQAGVWTTRLDEAIARGLRTGTHGHELVQMGPFKVITDGSLNSRSAYCHDPYPDLDGPGRFGQLLVGSDELVPLMRRASAHGIRSAIHAIGDHANSLALQAFEDSGAHGSIEHAQLLDADDVARFARLGVVASMQPEHLLDDRDVADHHWAGRTGRAFMLRSLLDAGARITLGSDAPVAPLDPWRAIAAAMSHTADGRVSWHPEQEISFAEALTASVAGPIQAGAPADLVLLDADPWSANPSTANPSTAHADRLRTMPVWATMVNGSWTHRG